MPRGPLCVIFMILVSLENVQKCVLGGVRLPQRLKSMFFVIFSHSSVPFGAAPFEKKIQKTLILAYEANSALSRENETKIVKITHIVPYVCNLLKKCLSFCHFSHRRSFVLYGQKRLPNTRLSWSWTRSRL